VPPSHVASPTIQLAAEIGYQHQEARTPSAKRTKKQMNICALICTDSEEYFQGDYHNPGEQILAGVAEQAQLLKANVEVHLIPPEADSLDHPKLKQITSLKKRSTSGVLLIYPFAESIIDGLSLHFPLVSLVDQLEHNFIDCVDVDHFNGVATTINHLLDLGHRRIGFYTKDYPIAASWSHRRYSAFIEKMARLKMPIAPTDLIGIFPRTYKTVEQSIDEVAKRTSQGVTAWVCAADHQAYDLINGLKKRGLKVPRDVSVTGFDGIEEKQKKPSLTTIKIPFREIGMSGTKRLSERIQKRFHESRHVYISGNLQNGKTTAKPKLLKPKLLKPKLS